MEWYYVCWPRLTAKRVELVVSISWASCWVLFRTSQYGHFDCVRYVMFFHVLPLGCSGLIVSASRRWKDLSPAANVLVLTLTSTHLHSRFLRSSATANTANCLLLQQNFANFSISAFWLALCSKQWECLRRRLYNSIGTVTCADDVRSVNSSVNAL